MQGRNWLSKTGWASSNATRRRTGGAFYSAKNWVGNCPPATYAPVMTPLAGVMRFFVKKNFLEKMYPQLVVSLKPISNHLIRKYDRSLLQVTVFRKKNKKHSKIAKCYTVQCVMIIRICMIQNNISSKFFQKFKIL
jgi:hypothetical protein